MKLEKLLDTVVHTLEEMKAEQILALDIQGLSCIADYLVICTARSSRHLKSVAEEVALTLKPLSKFRPNISGDEHSGWMVVDLGDIIVHVMLKEMREFYALEKLWKKD